MATYVVVEGVTERYVYKEWIPYVNSELNCHLDINMAKTDNDVYIISAQGYPDILTVIENAITDVNESIIFNKLVVIVDSESCSKMERYNEIKSHINSIGCNKSFHIIIQHFCIETWALGNRVIMRKSPQDHELKSYIKIFDVNSNDPELLPEKTDEELNRAQFAVKYLKAILRERFRNISYSKRNPEIITHKKYFTRINQRFNEGVHIKSFEDFINCFQPNP